MGEETFNGEKWIKKDREGDQFLALNEMPFMFAFEAVYNKWRAKKRPGVFLPSPETRK